MAVKAIAPAGAPKITAAHIRRGLQKMFPHPECGIVFEVAQATGFGAHRHLDAIAMDTWPSRGLIISGIEIKVDRHDWRREKANPSKAEQLARFCDKFYIAAPPGLVPIDELPHAWGLLEGGQDGMRVKKAAVKTKAEPITREFLAAVFRASGRSLGADDVEITLAAELQRLRDLQAEDVKNEAARLSTNNTDDAQYWRDLMAALGAGDGQSRAYEWDASRWIQVIKAVEKSGVLRSWDGLRGLQKTLGDMKTKIDDACTTLALPVSDDAAALARHVNKGRRLI